MINLHDRRKDKLDAVSVWAEDLPDIDLETVQSGDWIEYIGFVTDYALVGFLHHLGRHDFKIIKGKD